MDLVIVCFKCLTSDLTVISLCHGKRLDVHKSFTFSLYPRCLTYFLKGKRLISWFLQLIYCAGPRCSWVCMQVFCEAFPSKALQSQDDRLGHDISRPRDLGKKGRSHKGLNQGNREEPRLCWSPMTVVLGKLLLNGREFLVVHCKLGVRHQNMHWNRRKLHANSFS